MPKIVDYGVRLDLIAEAACALAVRDGLAGVTVPAVADYLDLSVSSLRRAVASSASLQSLAVRLLERRRRTKLLIRARPSVGEHPAARELGALLMLLPRHDEDVEEERAWRALSAGSEPSRLVAEVRGARDAELELAVHELLVAAGRATPIHQLRLRALVDGLASGLCDGRVAVEELTGVLLAELEALAPQGRVA